MTVIRYIIRAHVAVYGAWYARRSTFGPYKDLVQWFALNSDSDL